MGARGPPFPRGFAPLTEDDREQIAELRLRVVEAQAGETLSEIGQRTGNQWNVNETAVRNRKLPGVPLEAGEQIKIAVREPYRTPRERPDAEPERRARSTDRADDAAADLDSTSLRAN